MILQVVNIPMEMLYVLSVEILINELVGTEELHLHWPILDGEEEGYQWEV